MSDLDKQTKRLLGITPMYESWTMDGSPIEEDTADEAVNTYELRNRLGKVSSDPRSVEDKKDLKVRPGKPTIAGGLPDAATIKKTGLGKPPKLPGVQNSSLDTPAGRLMAEMRRLTGLVQDSQNEGCADTSDDVEMKDGDKKSDKSDKDEKKKDKQQESYSPAFRNLRMLAGVPSEYQEKSCPVGEKMITRVPPNKKALW